MDPIALLMDEHQIILGVLGQLDAWTHTADGPDSPARLAKICDFLFHFVDPIHHIKEEDLLFPAMVDHGFSRNHGPIAVMLHEHVQGRVLTDTLAQIARKTAPWSPQELTAARSAARDYAALLTQHIHKEDEVLYPMARARLPPAEMERLGLQMDLINQSPERATARERLLAAARLLSG